MYSERGAVEVEGLGTNPCYLLKTRDGIGAVKIELNGDLYPLEVRERIINWLEKGLLNPIDPPLKLLASDVRSR